MSGARIARFGRSRILIGLGVLFLIVGLYAFLGNSQHELNNARSMLFKCKHNLKTQNSQLEVLEMSLERRKKEQSEQNEKSHQETNVKLASLQQHYKLLKIQFDDFKEECSNNENRQSEMIADLKKEIQTLQDQNKHYKIKFENIKVSTENSNEHNTDVVSSDGKLPSSTPSALKKSFNAQVELTNNLYEIAIKYKNNSKLVENSIKTIDHDLNIKSQIAKNENLVTKYSPVPIKEHATVKMNTGKTNKIIDEISDIHRRKQIKLPNGVVPFQTNIDDTPVANHAQQFEELSNKNDVQIVNENNEIDHLKKIQPKHVNSDVGAQDKSDFVVDEHNIHVKQKNSEMLNNAEEPVYNSGRLLSKANKANNMNKNEDLQLINQADIGDEDNRILLNSDKLKNEVNEDQGKYPEDVNYQAEDEDDDEYTDHLSRKQGQALRERR